MPVFSPRIVLQEQHSDSKMGLSGMALWQLSILARFWWENPCTSIVSLNTQRHRCEQPSPARGDKPEGPAWWWLSGENSRDWQAALFT